MQDKNIGLIYDLRSYLTIHSIDGKNADYKMAKVLEMTPGKHDFVLAWDGRFFSPDLVGMMLSNRGKGSMYIDISLEVKPGYSYTFVAFENNQPIQGRK